MKKLRRKRLFALLCSLALMLGSTMPAFAETQPAVTVHSVTAAPGAQVTIAVDYSDFASVTALGLMVSYDPNVFTFVSAAPNGNMNMESVNGKVEGFVQYTGISDEGISGSGTLLSITFRVSDTAALQRYTLPVMVSEAKALVNDADADIAVSASAGKITVEQSLSRPNVEFFLSSSTYETVGGNDVEIYLYSYEPRGLAAGQFSFTYDSNLFEYKSLELMPTLTDVTYVSSVNAGNPGRVVLAYTADAAIAGGHLMTLTLTAKSAASGNGEIACQPLTLLDAQGEVLQHTVWGTASVTVTPSDTGIVYPKVWMDSADELVADRSFTVDLYVEGSSGLAAADFTVSYNTAELICESVVNAQGEDGEDITVVINDSFADGKIHFSMIYSPGISEDTKLISITFRPVTKAALTTQLQLEVSEPKDKDVRSIVLDCEDAALSLKAPPVAINQVAGNYAKLSFANAEQGRCYIAVYRSNGKMASCGVVDIPVNAGTITVPISGHTVKADDTVKAFLMDANGLPSYICEGI